MGRDRAAAATAVLQGTLRFLPPEIFEKRHSKLLRRVVVTIISASGSEKPEMTLRTRMSSSRNSKEPILRCVFVAFMALVAFAGKKTFSDRASDAYYILANSSEDYFFLGSAADPDESTGAGRWDKVPGEATRRRWVEIAPRVVAKFVHRGESVRDQMFFQRQLRDERARVRRRLLGLEICELGEGSAWLSLDLDALINEGRTLTGRWLLPTFHFRRESPAAAGDADVPTPARDASTGPASRAASSRAASSRMHQDSPIEALDGFGRMSPAQLEDDGLSEPVAADNGAHFNQHLRSRSSEDVTMGEIHGLELSDSLGSDTVLDSWKDEEESEVCGPAGSPRLATPDGESSQHHPEDDSLQLYHPSPRSSADDDSTASSPEPTSSPASAANLVSPVPRGASAGVSARAGTTTGESHLEDAVPPVGMTLSQVGHASSRLGRQEGFASRHEFQPIPPSAPALQALLDGNVKALGSNIDMTRQLLDLVYSQGLQLTLASTRNLQTVLDGNVKALGSIIDMIKQQRREIESGVPMERTFGGAVDEAGTEAEAEAERATRAATL